MSGDVQPRKRKDKKKKKDELGIDDPRGTAAVLGEGDVFIHSQQDHGTGGHWCAKIIFFSLLAVLITLIGLIILENRGLTELEANSVESRYSGVLEGWLEDSPDDHHDEHTLELKHHDNEGDEDHNDVESDEDENDQDDEESQEDNEINEEDDEDNDSNAVESNEDEEQDEDSADDDEDNDKNESEDDLQDEDSIEEEDDDDHNDDDDDNQDDSYEDDDGKNFNENDNGEDQSQENDDDDEEDQSVGNNNNEDDEDQSEENNDDRNYEDSDDDGEQSDETNDSQTLEDPDNDLSNEIIDNNDNGDYKEAQSYEENNIKYQKYSEEQDNENEDEQEDEDQYHDEDEEIEKIEKEINDEIESDEMVAKDSDTESSKEDVSEEAEDLKDTELRSLEEDDDEPPLERITMPPAGRPFVEIEEEKPEKPINTLAEEEEYEKRQEQIRKEEEAQGTQIWLKLAVGGALLVATHAVVRRATAPRDAPETEDHAREETPVVDRRNTLVAEQSSEAVQKENPVTKIAQQIEDDGSKLTSDTTPLVKNVNEEEIAMCKKLKKAIVEEVPVAVTKHVDEDEERYSDDEDLEDEEEEEDVEEPIKEIVQQKALSSTQQKPTEESEPEDVEIIDDEEIEEEQQEDDEDEEEISDVDDTELLTRLEAKYGRLPEPERPGQKHKDGGNSVDDDWPGEPSERYWREELDRAEEEFRQGAWSACEKRVNVAALAHSGRARWLAARALDMSAEAKRDNGLLSRAITAYLHLLKMNERLSDRKLLEIAQRTIDRIQFRGNYLNAEPIYRLLIRRFPNNVNYRNNLTVSFLMANRADLADEVLRETLQLWPNDRVALAHHGFVLKNQHNKLDEAVQALYKALEGDTGPANEPRFYYHLGDALLVLGRLDEAHEVHKRGATLGHFLSPSQRSLYNVPRLKSKPWWSAKETPYSKLIRALEQSWRDILKEAEAAKALYEKEKEGLKERGEWSQLDIFVRGSEIPGRCDRAPVTCSIVRSQPAAAGCRRGQVKFSAMSAGTHVRPHVGPTNCRLRMHLGLSNTEHTYIRVDKETRQWQVGKTFIFDDSFEHEVWHNGTGTRLVLIVDVWHPDLTAAERRTLPAI